MNRTFLALGALALFLGGSSITYAQATASPPDAGKPVLPADIAVGQGSTPTNGPRTMPPIRSESAAAPFGADMFQGGIGKQAALGTNPEHEISIGDEIDVRMWGAASRSDLLTVDAQGNIFIPEVGPIHVEGLRAKDLARIIHEGGRRIRRAVGVAQALERA
jgi:hypothetical protein